MATMASKEAPSSGSSSEERDPHKLFGEGKRHLACNEPQAAVECLQEACRKLVEKHGEMADELGEVYMVYGRALLDLSRQEAAVFGEKVPGVSGENDNNSDSDDDDDDDNAAFRAAVAASHTAVVAGLAHAASSSNVENGGEASSSSHVKEEQADEADEPGPSSAESGKSPAVGSDDDDDLTSLQLSWEVLETARVIFSKQDTKKGRYNLAEVYQLLGELNMEKESFEEAKGDLKGALEILQELEPQSSRLIAETQYTMGLANALTGNHSAAIAAYKAAVEALQLRLKDVQQKKEEASSLPEGERATVSQRAERETADINDILPDLFSKIEDQTLAQQQPALSDGLASALLGQLSSSGGTSSAAADGLSSSIGSQPPSRVSGPVNDISHLVRKRKADSDGPAAKRIQPTTLATVTASVAAASATTGVDVSGLLEREQDADTSKEKLTSSSEKHTQVISLSSPSTGTRMDLSDDNKHAKPTEQEDSKPSEAT